MGLIIPKRKPDWRSRLTGYLAAHSATPFKPGKFDCALFCAGAVQAMTGFDAARGWRGYRTLDAGFRKLESAGFENWWDMLAGRECDPASLLIGDVAIVKHGDVLAGGICAGATIRICTPTGQGMVPRSAAVKGYRI